MIRMIFPLIKKIGADSKYLVVSFLAGFGLMTLELAATRIVAPYIGNSIYTWTSIIGTVLLGSSVGYVWGGYKIDKNPSQKVVFGLSLGAALFIFLINIFVKILPRLAVSNMPMLLISAISALILFFIPSLLIGAISPCLLKLKTKGIEGVGLQSGLLSAFWAAGSILGTIFTGFFLVGVLGNQRIILLTAGIFLAISFVFYKKKRVLFALFFLLALFPIDFTKSHSSLIYRKESNYYSIEVIKGKIFPYGDVKILFLDSGSHGIESDDGEKIRTYPEIFPIFFTLKPDIANIHLIGGGAQTISKKMLSSNPALNIRSVEIDPEVDVVSKKYFSAENMNINFINGDARMDLFRNKQNYDLIFGDAFNSLAAVPNHLLTKEFNELVASRLNKGGIYALNIVSAIDGKNSELFLSILKTFSDVFPNHLVVHLGAIEKWPQNIVIVGINSDEIIDIEKLTRQLKKEEDGEWLASIIMPKEAFDLSDAQLLTDDFSPTEKLLFPIVNSYFRKYYSFYYALMNQ